MYVSCVCVESRLMGISYQECSTIEGAWCQSQEKKVTSKRKKVESPSKDIPEQAPVKKHGKGKKAAMSSSESRQQEPVQVVPEKGQSSASVASSNKRMPQIVPTADSVPLRKLTPNSNDFHRVGDNAGFHHPLNKVLLIRENWIIKVCKETGKRYFFTKDLGTNTAAFLTQGMGQKFIATGDVVF